jgi:hypothetical protein
MIKSSVEHFLMSSRYQVWFEDKPLRYIMAYKNKSGPAYVATAAIASLHLRDVNRLMAALEDLIDNDVFGERL